MEQQGVGPESRQRWQAALVVALLLAVFVTRALLDRPTLGLSFMYILPTLLAGVWFGVSRSVLVGAASAALYAVDAGLINAEPDPILGAVVRALVLCSVGAGFAILLERQLALRMQVSDHDRLRMQVSDRDRQIDELSAIRDALVPARLPEIPAIDLASCFVPAVEGVAGDFYLVAPGPEGATVIVVGDVTGKGIEASRRAAFARAALATFASFTDDPARLLELANYSLIERAGASETFVTAACIVVRPAERQVVWALAGHPAPVLLDDGSLLEVERPGLPLGLDIDLGLTAHRKELPPAFGLLVFTDGLIEARSGSTDENGSPRADSELFGVARVVELVRGLRGASPAVIVRAARDAAERFSGGALADDLCLVAARTSEVGPRSEAA